MTLIIKCKFISFALFCLTIAAFMLTCAGVLHKSLKILLFPTRLEVVWSKEPPESSI